MFVTSGCIVADPPEYREPVRTRPLLEVYKASPATADIVVWAKMSPQLTFTVPVRSEDAGEDMQAYGWKDYGTPVQLVVGAQSLPASTYDQSRDITLYWRPDAVNDRGCHRYTIVVAHQSTFLKSDSFRLDLTKAGDDAAIINWWVNVNPDNSANNSLLNCPQTTQPAPTP
jgi:hypothetical protein